MFFLNDEHIGTILLILPFQVDVGSEILTQLFTVLNSGLIDYIALDECLMGFEDLTNIYFG